MHFQDFGERQRYAFSNQLAGGSGSSTNALIFGGALGYFNVDDLVFVRNRFYKPSLGRFISLDPLGFEGDDFNLYIYAANDPLNNVDWEGTKKKKIKIAKILVGDTAMHLPKDATPGDRYQWWVKQIKVNRQTAWDVADLTRRFKSAGYEVHVDWEATYKDWRDTLKNPDIVAIAAIGHNGTAQNLRSRGRMLLGSINGKTAIGPTVADIRAWRGGRTLEKVILHVCGGAQYRKAFGFYGKRKKYFYGPVKCWDAISGGECKC